MKSVFLITCLVISATAAPQKTVEKSAKLQFTPADAQVYSTASREQASFSSAAGQVIPQSVYAAGGQVVPQIVYGAENVAPAYYGAAASYVPGVVNSVAYPANAVQGAVYPYSSVGRTTVTSTTQNGPTGTVYEHSGASHIGHLANAVHVKRPGQLYWNNNQPQVSTVYGAPTVQASYYNGQIQYVNGQPVTYSNGQWYYTNAATGGLALPVPSHLWSLLSPYQTTTQNQYSSVYTNLLNAQRPVSYIPSIPQNWANAAGKTTFVQQQQPLAGGQSWSQSTVGVRPSVQSDKWYTKTNTQQVVQPFYGQPQYTQQVAAASQGVKGAAVRPEGESEKADW